MKFRTISISQLAILVIGLLVTAPFLAPAQFSVSAQLGNRISGFVFGLERRPVADVDVELLDEYSQTRNRTRTNGSGQYTFMGMSHGRYTIRVRPFMTGYEEQEASIELTSMNRPDGSGGVRAISANEQKDFYLRLKRGVSPMAVLGTVFAEEVPPEAKKLYDRAVADLAAKRENEAYANLRAALEIFPKYFAALEMLGTGYVQMGRPAAYAAAEILLKMAVELNPHGYKSWYGLAYAQFSQGKHADAIKAAHKAVELNSYSAEYVLLYGILSRYAKNHADAEKHLLKAKEISNDSIPRVHLELALLYGNDLKRYADAARELKLYLKVQPPDAAKAEELRKLIETFEAKAAAKT